MSAVTAASENIPGTMEVKFYTVFNTYFARGHRKVWTESQFAQFSTSDSGY